MSLFSYYNRKDLKYDNTKVCKCARHILKCIVTYRIPLETIEQLLHRFSKNVYNFDPYYNVKKPILRILSNI